MNYTTGRQKGSVEWQRWSPLTFPSAYSIHDDQTRLQVEYLNDPERCGKQICEEIIKAVRDHLVIGNGNIWDYHPTYEGFPTDYLSNDGTVLSYLLGGVVHLHDLQQLSLNYIRSVTPFQWYLPLFIVIQQQRSLEDVR